MLHIVTALYRPKLLKKIYKSLETANKQKFIQKHNIRKYQINRIMFAKKFNKIVQEIKFN